MNILIFGYGLRGGGFYNAMYFLKKGHNVRITDIREENSLGEGISVLKEKGAEVIAGSHRVEDFKWADIVVKTPAISPDSPFLDYSKKTLNDFAFLFSDKHIEKVKLICITGTIGKTITSAALCHCLNKLGKKARMCGNMGISPFTELEKWEKSNIPEYLVCELSSWQVRDTYAYLNDMMPDFEIAVFTNTLFENDNSNDNIQMLYNQKFEIFGKKAKDILCRSQDKNLIAKAVNRSTRKINSIDYYGTGLQKGIPENLRITFSILKRMGFSSAKINEALRSFKGVPHRNEIVKHIKNILVINDSASTIPQAVSFTINNLGSGTQIHIICGGTGKDLNPTPVTEAVKNVKSVTLLDGSFTQKLLIPQLKKEKIRFSGPFSEMKDAVESAMKQTDPEYKGTEIVILSPGASAFEYFANEYERGEAFKACFEQFSKLFHKF